MSNLNWNDLVDQAAEASKPIPEGQYNLMVESAKWKPSKAGNPMMALIYRVVGGPEDGKQVRHWIALGNKDFQIIQFVAAFKSHGVNNPDLSAAAEILEAQFINSTVGAVLKHDGEYNGQPNVRIDNFTSAGSAGVAGLTPPPLAAPAAVAEAAPSGLTPPPLPAV